MRSSGRPQNEALQQTRSALTTTAAALAAERRCCADASGMTSNGSDGFMPPVSGAGAEPWRCLPIALRLAHPSTRRLHGRPAQRASTIGPPALDKARKHGAGQTVERRSQQAGLWKRAAAVVPSSSPQRAALRAEYQSCRGRFSGIELGVSLQAPGCVGHAGPPRGGGGRSKPTQNWPHNEGMKQTKPAIPLGSRGLRSLSRCCAD